MGIPKDTLYGRTRAEGCKSMFGGEASSFSGPMTETEKGNVRLKRENRDLQDALEILVSHQHSGRLTESIYASTFEVTSAESEHRFSVSVVLRHLGVLKSGYYAWINRKPSDRDFLKQKVVDAIKELYDDSFCICGAPKIADEFHKRGFNSAVRTVTRYMKELGSRVCWIKRDCLVGEPTLSYHTEVFL